MSQVCRAVDASSVDEAVEVAAEAVRRGEVVVLPTDTVYGVGADAFDRTAVAMVLAAKHRRRDKPPPVLIGDERTLEGLATAVPEYARTLIRAYWPGPLTLVFQAQPSLTWDLGETGGTVALRMPADSVAIRLLKEIGPMAVTSANLTGHPPATTAEEAQEQLGGAVAVYVDAGPRGSDTPSTIVDCTRAEPVILRAGALSPDALREVLGAEVTLHDSPEDAAAVAQAAAPDETPATTDEASADAPVTPELPGTLRPSTIDVPEESRRVLAPEAGDRPDPGEATDPAHSTDPAHPSTPETTPEAPAAGPQEDR